MDSRQIVARFITSFGDWDGKFLGRDCRLRWGRHGWRLEEMPQKGKKKLRVSTIDNLSMMGWTGFSAFIPENILRDAKLSRSDNYDRVKDKLDDAFRAAAELTLEKVDDPSKFEWIREPRWSEWAEHFLKIEPEGTDPFLAEGKDFKVNVKWTSFSAYSPDSDFQQADPHYTEYASTAPAAARKLYRILKADPTALKNVTWDRFDEFLKKNKINYETNFSVWH